MRGLAIDSSTKSLSLAILEDGTLRAERFLNSGYTHSETLMPEVESLLESLALNYKDFDYLSVSNGPGSYTGLRIGLSTMKTLAWFLQKPLFTFSTLDVMKRAYERSGKFILPVLDARRGRIFSALYKGEKRILSEDNRTAIELIEELKELFYKDAAEPAKLYVTGDGSSVLLEAYAEDFGVEQHFSLTVLEEGLADLRSYYAAALAEEAYLRGERPTWAEAEANYLSPTQAERVRKEALAAMYIREGNLDDVDPVHFIERSCFPTPWSKKSLSAQLDPANRHAHLYLIFSDETEEELLGYAGFYMHIDEAEILNIAVLPEYRRSGVGRKILTYLLDSAKSRGAKRITLEVRESNTAARRLYASLGFSQCGVRHNYYDKPREDALILEWREERKA